MIDPSRTSVPVIAIDGPGGSGKGTVSTAVARYFGWHYLDSGAIYRVLGYLAHVKQVSEDDVSGLVALTHNLDIVFAEEGIFLDGQNAEGLIRTEEAADRASRISPIPEVRRSLLQWQRNQARLPGLVSDGRDMGSVVFPDALCKFFITANSQKRAERRYKQLREKGFDVRIEQLLREIAERDERDAMRKASPLKPAEDATVIDTTEMNVDDVISTVLEEIERFL
ncbi:MAG: (d)CMP kinase [Gammaproteobacteria bacterium]|nr:(d)CMP kinase [Gammaproteobacteria bacterium]MCY4217818.1 (d)CMP kinase [Gammaproteobacteria bacterium]MCY4274906.1 (d)CMP kinase [Gammaproteobacteria bacterium]